MKTLKHFFPAMVAVLLVVTTSAQTPNNMNMKMASTKTETFKVWGNCDMCKARIEKAVKEEGATSATWDQKTKLLTVSFDPSKSSAESFGKKLARVGHDTEKFKADEKTYNALPACCKYERSDESIKADYTCPMHSDVHSDKPGKCPKCGMELVKLEKAKKQSEPMQHQMSMMMCPMPGMADMNHNNNVQKNDNMKMMMGMGMGMGIVMVIMMVVMLI